MKNLLLSVIILSVIGCALIKPSTTSTVQTKRQITYKWSQIENYFTKNEVEKILGIPTDILYSEEAEIWKYEYDIALLVSVKPTIVYGFCQNHPFSERYTLTYTILSTFVISLMHLLILREKRFQ